jgi:hypothetical protein
MEKRRANLISEPTKMERMPPAISQPRLLEGRWLVGEELVVIARRSSVTHGRKDQQFLTDARDDRDRC